MIPPDIASSLRSHIPDQSSTHSAKTQPPAPIQRVTDALSNLVPGQRVMAEIQALLPNGSYRALVAQREVTLALPFSAKAGDSLELEVQENQGKLTLAFVANRSEPAQGKGQPVSVATSLSQAGKLIGDLLQQAGGEGKRAPPAPLNGNQALVTTMPKDAAAQLAPILKQALSQSGMFYEAHQARWVAGRLPTAQLKQEPQGRLPPNLSPPTPTTAATASTTAPSAQVSPQAKIDTNVPGQVSQARLPGSAPAATANTPAQAPANLTAQPQTTPTQAQPTQPAQLQTARPQAIPPQGQPVPAQSATPSSPLLSQSSSPGSLPNNPPDLAGNRTTTQTLPAQGATSPSSGGAPTLPQPAAQLQAALVYEPSPAGRSPFFQASATQSPASQTTPAPSGGNPAPPSSMPAQTSPLPLPPGTTAPDPGSSRSSAPTASHQPPVAQGSSGTAATPQTPGTTPSTAAPQIPGSPVPEAGRAPLPPPPTAQPQAPVPQATGGGSPATPPLPATPTQATTQSPATTPPGNPTEIASTKGSVAANTTTLAVTAERPATPLQTSTGIPRDIAPIVQQQLDGLANQNFVWQGQVWPGQKMWWEIGENPEDARKAGDEAGVRWRTRIKLDLPVLGEVEARLFLQADNQLSLRILTDKPETESQLKSSLSGLIGQFENAGLSLRQVEVRHEPAAEA